MPAIKPYHQLVLVVCALFACPLSFSIDDDQTNSTIICQPEQVNSLDTTLRDIENFENVQNATCCPTSSLSQRDEFTRPINFVYSSEREVTRKHIFNLFLTGNTTQAHAELEKAEGIVQFMVGVDLIPFHRQESKTCFEMVTKSDGNHIPKQVIASAYHNLSCILGDEGKTTQALQYAFKAATSHDPDALLNVGNLLCKTGKLSEALGYFMLSSRLGNPVATESLKHVIHNLSQKPLSPLDVLRMYLVQKGEERALYYQSTVKN